MTRRLLAILTLTLGAWLGATAQLNTDRVIQVGRNALYFQDYVLAVRYFSQVIDAKPYLSEPYFLRAIAKYNLEDYAGALADATLATEVNPFQPDAWEVRGVAHQCLDRHADAVADYTRALELLPHNRQLLFNKALAQESARLYADADSTYGELLEFYPRFADAYVGRAQLRLQQADTVAARADLGRALELDGNSVAALSLRAALTSRADPAAALADMERAVTLQPDRTYLRINRAVARYHANDLNGALSDFDYVLELEPTNYAALFNRAMLRAELRDNDRALLDLNRALQLRPSDLRARYNRAVVLADKGDLKSALADADEVVATFPDQYAGYALRAHINHLAGNNAAANADARRANRIARTPPPGEQASAPRDADDDEPADVTADTANRFKTLLTLDDENDRTSQTFNAEGLLGRVQDRGVAMSMLPIYQLSYYTADSELSSAVFVREIDELNSARVLPFVVFVTNNVPAQTPDTSRHFESIQRLGSLINSGKARPVDRFARAMDHMTLRDYSSALTDIDAVIAAMPDFAPAYLLRAAARYQLHESGRGSVTVATDASTGERLNAESAMALRQIMDDLDQALRLNPRMAVAHYNRGTILMQLGAYADAIDAFSRAVEIEPNLGSAWFNRGYVYFSQGNRDAAVADISRAGQLGIPAAYPMLKRLQR